MPCSEFIELELGSKEYAKRRHMVAQPLSRDAGLPYAIQPQKLPLVPKRLRNTCGMSEKQHFCYTYDEFSFGCSAIRLHPTMGMACAEYRRLEHQYEAAVRAWMECRAPLTVLLPSRPKVDRRKEEALLARNRAADLLYLHRRWCTDCKKGDVELVDLSDLTL
jgi:hypothetical protein